MHKLEQHQQITPLTATSVADQGIAYLKYQQALIFSFQAAVFNALTVISISSLYSKDTQDLIFVPNVNSRPVRIGDYSSWIQLFDKAQKTYIDACLVYEAELEEMKNRVAKIFDSPFFDDDLGDENELVGDAFNKE